MLTLFMQDAPVFDLYTYFPDSRKKNSVRLKWGKVSDLFSWLHGGETMKIELFINVDSESLIFCEQICGKIKAPNFHKTP